MKPASISPHQLLFASTTMSESFAVHGYALARQPELIPLPQVALPNASLLVLHLSGPHVLRTLQHGSMTTLWMHPGSSCLLPTWMMGLGSWNAPAEVLHIYLAETFLEELSAAQQRPPAMLRYQHHFQDALIQQIGLSLRADLQQGSPSGPRYVESLVQTLALHLLQHYAPCKTLCPLSACAEDGCKLQRVLEYIDARLSASISLDELAALAGFSTSYLTRLFHQQIGLSPHQYLIKCRAERARELLSAGQMSISDVAQAVGFADQSHLDRHFKRLFGISPGEILRSGQNHPIAEAKYPSP